jgi:hypothetical protein
MSNIVFQRCAKPGQPCFKKLNKKCQGCNYLSNVTKEMLDRLEASLNSKEKVEKK